MGAIRVISIFIAVSLFSSCLMSSPTFASSETAQSAVQTESIPTPTATTTTATTANTTPTAIPTTGSAITANPGTDAEKPAVEDESLWYSKKNPMKKEHQKLLWDYCKKRDLDYIDMLALIYIESNFKEKCSTKRYKGYFQISTAHGPNLSKTLKTENKPLDGAININWGTAMYSWILADKRVKDLKDKAKRDAALSIYQRGTGGYDKYGLSKSYLKKYYKKREIVCSWFEQAKL